MDELNRHHNTIKFTANWSTEEVTFLDKRVYMKNGLVETNLHIKPTDTHQYLRTNSCHPRHFKTDIPYGQALRLAKDIRDNTDFLNKLNSLPSLPPGSLLVTLDVSSLCTNIPHDEGVAACEEALNSRELLIPPTADLCSLIKLIFIYEFIYF